MNRYYRKPQLHLRVQTSTIYESSGGPHRNLWHVQGQGFSLVLLLSSCSQTYWHLMLLVLNLSSYLLYLDAFFVMLLILSMLILNCCPQWHLYLAPCPQYTIFYLIPSLCLLLVHNMLYLLYFPFSLIFLPLAMEKWNLLTEQLDWKIQATYVVNIFEKPSIILHRPFFV